MRTGVFGGSFNPVHLGHVHLARSYIKALLLDRLLIIPNHMPPHKSGQELVGDEHRLAMCRLAFAQEPACIISDLEIRRKGKSFTVDTLEQLAVQYPEDELFLLMGSDMYLSFTTWRNWGRIGELAVLCAGARNSMHTDVLEEQKIHLAQKNIRSVIVPIEPFEISSTQIRADIKTGKHIADVVPAAVAEYIAKNQLYL